MTTEAIQYADIVSLERFRRTRGADLVVDPVIRWVRCRVGVCMTRCGITATAVYAMNVMNAELARRRERQFGEDDFMVCGEHTSVLGGRSASW